ncbi:MAG: Periplasmic thiol:disulfide interchange protein DsbA [Microgenomates group bacterium GW2011_GWA2_40_6]|nr:MAG: Periplasmic thiol:disulfide interchange protein DsbA [Microgenomates group bacterium GW2011_GWA2_40_6]
MQEVVTTLCSMIKKNNDKNKNFVEMSHFSFYFFAALLLIMTFVGGVFFGRTSNASLPLTQPQVQPQAQQQAQAPAQPQISLDTIKELFTKDLIKFGKGDKKLLMVEVADPSCPYCHVAGGANDEIGAQIGPQFKLVSAGGSYVAPVAEMKKLVLAGKADFVWIYTNGHGNGEMATKALYCAFDQGKFWQAHDLLMSAKGYTLINDVVKNDTTKSQQVVDFLASALDKNKLKSCLDSGKYNSRLKEDSAIASSLGVNGTPGFFLNTTNFSGAYSWTDMKSVAEAAL